MTGLPRGFGAHVDSVGIKDARADFVVIGTEEPCAAAGVFTRSRFAGPSVEISRRHLEVARARALVIISKNANVATGPGGTADAAEIVSSVAARVGCPPTEVLIASTGVIGRRYPMDRVRSGIERIPVPLQTGSAEEVAEAIMTTDTVPKVVSTIVAGSEATVVGIAKGVGMIEPDMATMIAVLLTDAGVDAGELDTTFRGVVARTFNCVSVDTDTSTSDTAIVLASGAVEGVEPSALATALHDVAQQLTKMIAADGEGAETLIEVRVDGARDDAQAKRVAKSIVNSPLVKTAVHGADPNWGRVAMAIGKCSDDFDIDQDRVVIRFGDRSVYPEVPDDSDLAELSTYLAGPEVLIHVSLDIAEGKSTVWGCDLTAEYIRINADYTT